jgi:hypothetical protein
LPSAGKSRRGFHHVSSSGFTMLQAIFLILIGGAGIWFSLRALRRNWRDYQAKKGTMKVGDVILHYGLSFLWFGFLLAFFTGLIVNNLILR